MSVLTDESSLSLCDTASGPVEESVEDQVAELLTRLYPRNAVTERRRENRYPFPYLVRLIPVDDAFPKKKRARPGAKERVMTLGILFDRPDKKADKE